jgi:prephenate dehydratase
MPTPSPVSCWWAAPAPPAPTGADKTSLIVELPEEYPGALMEMLEQFATRGINLSLLASRPIGDALGRYRFVIDADGTSRTSAWPTRCWACGGSARR